jgi:hypothetical protein
MAGQAGRSHVFRAVKGALQCLELAVICRGGRFPVYRRYRGGPIRGKYQAGNEHQPFERKKHSQGSLVVHIGTIHSDEHLN